MTCSGWASRRRAAGRPAGADSSAASAPRGRRRHPESSTGQATVELALVLPLVFILLLVLVEAGLVVRDQVLVVHAAREAARAAAVDENAAASTQSALAGTGLDGIEVVLTGRDGPGSHVTATVRYAERGRLPFLSVVSSRLVLTATATMRVEGSNASDRPPPTAAQPISVPPFLANKRPIWPSVPPESVTTKVQFGPLEPQRAVEP